MQHPLPDYVDSPSAQSGQSNKLLMNDSEIRDVQGNGILRSPTLTEERILWISELFDKEESVVAQGPSSNISI